MVNPLTLPPITEDRRPKRRKRSRLFELFKGRSVRQARDDREAGLWDWLKKNGYTAVVWEHETYQEGGVGTRTRRVTKIILLD